MDEQEKLANSFNTHVNWLIGVARKYAIDERAVEHVDRIRGQVQTLLLTDSMMIITLAGPRLFTYRKYISEGDSRFFLDKNYEEDVEESDSKKSTVIPIVISLKKSWPTLKTKMKKLVFRRVQLMLSDYLKFKMLEKKPKRKTLLS